MPKVNIERNFHVFPTCETRLQDSNMFLSKRMIANSTAEDRVERWTRYFECLHCFSGFKYFTYFNHRPCLWVPVTTAWHVLRLRMEEQPPIWRVAANKRNKQSRTADKGWSSSWGVGRGTNNSSPWNNTVTKYSWARCFLWRQNNPEVKHSPTRISGGECF